MPSAALQRWFGPRGDALDEIEAAHRSVGGSGRGRRYATEQINHASAVLLSSQFQGFCRDLHSDCAFYFIGTVSPAILGSVLRPALLKVRKLDRGNANLTNIGLDFNRFGLQFWNDVRSADPRSAVRMDQLEELNRWRNAIAHQDFDPAVLGTTALRVERVRRWLRACHGLARTFDEVMRGRLFTLINRYPW